MAHPTSVAPKLESIHLEIRIGSACNICTLQYLLSCNICFFATFSSMQHLLSCNICPVQQLQHLHWAAAAPCNICAVQHLHWATFYFCATFALYNICFLATAATFAFVQQLQHLLSCNSCNIYTVQHLPLCNIYTVQHFTFVQQLHPATFVLYAAFSFMQYVYFDARFVLMHFFCKKK